MAANDIVERNIERLISEAYRPEPVDPAFIAETEEKLLAAARETIVRVTPQPAEAPRLLRIRRRLSIAMSAAAALAACWVAYYAATRGPVPFDPRPHTKDVAALPRDLKGNPFLGQTAKPRPQAPRPTTLAAGQAIATEHGQRRRVVLADGSILYVNENTSLRQPSPRRLVLDKGEIYLEVAPRPDGEQFVVETPERKVTAVGTHFGVLASGVGSGVLVTQGKVKVSDVPGDVPAGQQVPAGKKQAQTAPRASHVLDWARDLMTAADASLVPARQHEGGALVAIDPNGQELQLSLRKYHIDVHVEDGFARTTIDQTYFNDTWGRLEGTFYFPLPPDASLSRLAMYVVDGKDCKLNEGGMAERDHARNAYETIRHERRDPALLEWVDGSTFKMRVFPLEAWQEKRIVLSYTQRLPSLYGVVKYRFPGGLNMPVVRDWSFNVDVKNAANWDVVCASHPDANRATPRDNEVSLDYHAKHVKPDRDVALELREREAPADGASFSTHLHDGQRYFMARYRPKLDSKAERQRRDWVVLFETSANRDPLLARTQIEVFRNLFKNAEYDDTFRLLTVSTKATAFDEKALPATPDNIKAAVEFLERAHLVGGCDLEQGLKQAVALAEKTKNPHIVHLGAGVGSLGEFKDDVLAKLIPDNVRYIGVGIGKKWNRAFMKQAADRTGGYFTQINPDEPIAWRAFDLLATLNTPRLLDVRVIDAEEKATFLSDVVTLAQGEDVCAFTRGPADTFFVPSKVIVSGRLDGKPLRREIAVQNVSENAGYLPRTWAKLEIDRLMAEGQDKNKTAITALSKSMYVMSPFTSLLVLESEADYQRFNIDRGRKDHWAMYATPERVPLVYEPDPYYRNRWWGWNYEEPKDGKKLPPEQVLDSILVRMPPNLVQVPGRHSYIPTVTTAQQINRAIAVSEESLVPGEESGVFLGRLARAGDVRDGRLLLRLGDVSTDELRRAGRLTDLVRELAPARPQGERLAQLLAVAGAREEPAFLDVFGRAGRGEWERLGLERLEALPMGGQRGANEWFFLADERKARTWGLPAPQAAAGFGAAEPVSLGFAIRSKDLSPIFLQGGDAKGLSLDLAFKGGKRSELSKLLLMEDLAENEAARALHLRIGDWFQPALRHTLGSLDGIAWDEGAKKQLVDLWIARLAQRLTAHQSASWLSYQEPSFQPDERLFKDLMMYAPGLGVSLGDIQHVLSEEARLEHPPLPGKIDAAARKLIDRARQTGWRQVSYAGVGKIPATLVRYNGQGQFTYDRMLPTGLTERVVCDGATLWHLYGEIGLGAARPFNRHHHAELSSLVPGFVPAAEDIALDADLEAIDAHTVALVAHASRKLAKDAKFAQVRFVFAPEGPLAEIQIVEMPAGKVLLRQTLTSGGEMKLLDADGKTLAEHKVDLKPASAPDIRPNLDEMVILDMPVRHGNYYRARMGNADQPEKLTARDRLGYFAATCFSVTGNASLNVFGEHYHAKGDRRVGFYTLLTMAGAQFQNQANSWGQGIATYDVVKEHPASPLARYLAHHQKNASPTSNADNGRVEFGEDAADGFVRRLAGFRAAWQVFRFNLLGNAKGENYHREYVKVHDFIRISNTSPLFAFALMSTLQHAYHHERGPHAGAIADSMKEYVQPLGLGYVFQYQAAVAEYQHSNQREAAAQRFRKLYETALEAGVLPKVDRNFSSALDQAATGPKYGPFMRDVVRRLLKQNQPHFAILAALQAAEIGSQGLGDELLLHIQQHRQGKADRLELLAQLEYLAHNRVDGRAEALCDQLLAEKDLAERSGVWRLSAAVAQRRENKARALAHFEEALERDYRDLPEFVNLEAVRTDYRAVLQRYLDVARAIQTLGGAAPNDLAGKVVKAADRWRALDADNTEVCTTTARIFETLGARDLAWLYLTTPLALKPNESGPWVQVADELRDQGELERADHAYARAFECESTNPQILWQRAQNLLQMGRVDQARALWRQIAEGGWQERFQTLVPQARWHLEHQ
jgi:tetratricopeptide (TPR) repeat protein